MSRSKSISDEGSPDGRKLRYVHSTTAAEQRRLERRTAETSAGFLAPHLSPGMRLLDCGCGPGSITVGLATLVAPGEVIGLDLQAEQLERAGALAARQGISNLRLERGSVYELPFPDGSMDAVFAHNLLVHLANPSRAVQEMRRVLRPGGVVGIADDDMGTWLWEPSTPRLVEVERIFRRAVEHHGGDPYRPRHHRRLLREAGFARPVAGASLGCIGVYGTDEHTHDFAAWFVEQITTPAFIELVTTQGWADRDRMDLLAAEVQAWGNHPDAFLAGFGVTALGWVEQ